MYYSKLILCRKDFILDVFFSSRNFYSHFSRRFLHNLIDVFSMNHTFYDLLHIFLNDFEEIHINLIVFFY